MRRDRYRFLSTLVVWVILLIIVLVTLLAMGLGVIAAGMVNPVFLGLLTLAGLAVAATFGIWRDAAARSADRQATEQQVEKAKRTSRDRIERLVETLEDEIVELETLLRARDEDTLR